jgi:GntR family transcriptional regulator
MPVRPAKRELVTPLYNQIYLVLREKIRAGEFGEDGRLPTESALCDTFKVSRITIRRALEELEHDDLVTRLRGSGTFARSPVPVRPISSSMADYLEYRRGIAEVSDAKLISFDYVVPPPFVRSAMQCRDGETVQMSVRTRSYKSTPFLHLTVYTVAEIGRMYTKEQLKTEALLSLLRRNVEVSSAEQIISATLASPEVADLLQVEIGAPLIKVTFVISDERGKVVEYVISLARPDMYQLKSTLRFDTTGASAKKKRASRGDSQHNKM